MGYPGTPYGAAKLQVVFPAGERLESRETGHKDVVDGCSGRVDVISPVT